MKFVAAVLIFSTLSLGSECIDLKEFGSEIFQDTVKSLSNFLAPIQEAQVGICSVYDRVKTNYHKTGSMIRSPDDCLKLTNTSQQAYSLAVNVTDFGVAAVKELGDSMNTLIDCAQEALYKQLNCVFDKLDVVRSQVIELQQQLDPYLSEGTSIYNQLVEELQECL